MLKVIMSLNTLGHANNEANRIPHLSGHWKPSGGHSNSNFYLNSNIFFQ